MTPRQIDRANLDFMLFDWLGLEELLVRDVNSDHSRESITALLDLADRIARERFLTHYKDSDRIEPRIGDDGVAVLPAIKAALKAFADAGFFAAPAPARLGGMAIPEVVQAASMAHFMAANVSTAAYAMLTVANARLLIAHGTEAQIDAFVRPQMTGDALGTMCLSEPQAGSSLADIRTCAVADGNDRLGERFRLFGNKMWISGGDQDISDNIVHLVLAKVRNPDGSLPQGTEGISLFIAPKYLSGTEAGRGERNDIAVAGLNHKMGQRGTSNCMLNFGEGSTHRPAGQAGAIGYLVGELGKGLAIMFHMMNEARIGVGLGAAALASRGHMLSIDYARERLQGRAGDGRPCAIIEHPDVRRMLMSQKCFVDGAFSLVLYCARLVDERITAPEEDARRQADELLGLLTPAAKTWPSEWGLAANDLAIQIHGGYGYTRDFDVEQLYRDNRLNPIHEGTTGIQGIDFVSRKLLRDRGAALALLRGKVAATSAAARGNARLCDVAERLDARWDRFGEIVEELQEADRQVVLANATEMLAAFGHLVVAWLLLDQLVALATSADAANRSRLVEAKHAACRFFFDIELPRVDRSLAIVGSVSDAVANVPREAFA